MKLIVMFVLFTLCQLASAQNKVAIVNMIRGDVVVVENGKEVKLAKEMWVNSGSVVKTKDKSFVKLVFIDKSQMNVGPNSEMKIEKFGGSEAGVIDLVKGKIRSQVSKDYLQQQDKTKSKMFVKTPNAVMGIRGTDFLVSTNGTNTAHVLFEGSVMINALPDQEMGSANFDTTKLETIVSEGERMIPGQFSSTIGDQAPTVPATLNPQQMEKLEKNDTFQEATPVAADDKVTKSVVPQGLSGAAVGNDPESLKSEVKQVTDSSSAAKETPVAETSSGDAAGFVDGNKIKPANGSFVDLNSGVVIPPAADSVLDKTTNTYIASAGSGKVDVNGNYVPPKGIEITDDGKILTVNTNAAGVETKKEIQIKVVMDKAPMIETKINSPMPGTTQTPMNTFGGTAVGTAANMPIAVNPSMPVNNDIMNSNFTPSGLNDVSNFQNNSSGGLTPTTAVQESNTTHVNINITKP